MQNMQYFIITVILLFGLIIILFCFWLHTVRKNAERRFALKNAEKDEIEQLHNEIKSLRKQIEAYKQIINEFNLDNEKQQRQMKEENLLNLMIIDDIIKLINKKLPGKDEYIEALKRIDGQFIVTLKSIYKGNLSVPYLKYCVCFAIGMEIGEVSECFSIEQSSVHMVRYRLKKKFGLSNHEEFNVFLRQLNM